MTCDQDRNCRTLLFLGKTLLPANFIRVLDGLDEDTGDDVSSRILAFVETVSWLSTVGSCVRPKTYLEAGRQGYYRILV